MALTQLSNIYTDKVFLDCYHQEHTDVIVFKVRSGNTFPCGVYAYAFTIKPSGLNKSNLDDFKLSLYAHINLALSKLLDDIYDHGNGD